MFRGQKSLTAQSAINVPSNLSRNPDWETLVSGLYSCTVCVQYKGYFGDTSRKTIIL